MRLMTEGNISKNLLKFILPMILGNIFQQLYNITDSIVVGRFVGKNALAAVGSAFPIMSIALFLIVGLCIGTAILMAEFFGGGEIEKLKREISTTLICGIIFTVFIAGLFFAFSYPLLKLISTPKEIINDCDIYLKIIFCGLIFSFLYNIYTSALRAVGDSKAPLIFLIVSVILNIILDLIFVLALNLGVKGVAFATIVSQALSAVFIILYIRLKVPELKLKKKDLKIDKSLLKQTINYSWVTATQQTALYVGKLLVQGAVNPLGVDSIAAYNAVTRVDSFALAPSDSLNVSITTFTAQNKGAKQFERINKGFKQALKMGIYFNIAISLIVYLLASNLLKIFLDPKDTEAIYIGIKYLKIMSIFYVGVAFCNVFQGFFRGLGDLKVTLLATIVNMTFRIVLVYILAPIIGLSSVAVATVGGWAVMITLELVFYLKIKKNNYIIDKKSKKLI
jgi:putative MATE family efflux protein